MNLQANSGAHKSHRPMKIQTRHVLWEQSLSLLLLLPPLLLRHFDLIKIDAYLIIAHQKLDSMIYFHSVHVHLADIATPNIQTHTQCIDWPQVMLRFESLIKLKPRIMIKCNAITLLPEFQTSADILFKKTITEHAHCPTLSQCKKKKKN